LEQANSTFVDPALQLHDRRGGGGAARFGRSSLL
jgi:hypothetical protein